MHNPNFSNMRMVLLLTVSLPCTQKQISLVINITAVYPPPRFDPYSCLSPSSESTASPLCPATRPPPIASVAAAQARSQLVVRVKLVLS